MGCEMNEEFIEGYVQIILHLEVDSECPRHGAYIKNMREVETS